MLKPLPLLVLLVGNTFFATALYFGFKITAFPVPIAIATGVIASFVYSLFFLGGTLTLVKIAGVIAIIIGIFLLK